MTGRLGLWPPQPDRGQRAADAGGDGHTSYLLPGLSRTRDAIDTYLITGVMPPPNTVYPD